MDDERHFLLDGKWHVFNQNYITFLQQTLDEKIELQTPSVNLSDSNYKTWHLSLTEEDKKGPCYREIYFNNTQENEGYINCDRKIETLQKYKIEKLDLYKDETAYFVKIGTPQKLSYAIDQSIATIKVLQNTKETININGKDVKPTKICLWFILDRRIPVKKISDINSLIFMMKLNEWQKQCINAGYTPIVRLGYIAA